MRPIQCKCLERVVKLWVCNVRLVWECGPRLGKAYFHHPSELGDFTGNTDKRTQGKNVFLPLNWVIQRDHEIKVSPLTFAIFAQTGQVDTVKLELNSPYTCSSSWRISQQILASKVFITDNLRTNTWQGKNRGLSYKGSLAASLVGNKLWV